jgi:hypothetical protein
MSLRGARWVVLPSGERVLQLQLYNLMWWTPLEIDYDDLRSEEKRELRKKGYGPREKPTEADRLAIAEADHAATEARRREHALRRGYAFKPKPFAPPK